jgi:hypothetical protein
MKFKSFNSARLADVRTQMAALRAEALELKRVVLQEKANQAEVRQIDREAKARRAAEKQALAIVRAETRLARLMEKKSKPVGVKALRANRRPSKATVTQASA